MLLDEKMRQVAAWLTKAKRDVEAAKNDLAPAISFNDSAVFHCQQAAEKALKGFLVYHDCPFRKTHEIRELASQVISIDPGLELLLIEASALTPYANVFRYPGELVEPDSAECLEAIQLAERVVQEIEKRLPLPQSIRRL